jgi:hypothetical protein
VEKSTLRSTCELAFIDNAQAALNTVSEHKMPNRRAVCMLVALAKPVPLLAQPRRALLEDSRRGADASLLRHEQKPALPPNNPPSRLRVLMVWVYERTRSVMMAILMHAGLAATFGGTRSLSSHVPRVGSF